MIDIRPYEPVEPLVELTSFAIDLVPGDSVPLEFWVVNTGDEAAADVQIEIAERPIGDIEWSFDAGPIVSLRRARIEIVDGYGGATVVPAVYYVGAGMRADLGAIAAGEGVKLELVITSPLEQQPAVIELQLGLRPGAADVVGPGYIGIPQGVRGGARQGLSGLTQRGTVVPAAPVAATVTVAAVGGWVSGVPSYVTSAVVALSATDAAAAALVLGEEYASALILGVAGIEVVKGLKGVAPVGPEGRPVLTADQELRLVAWVARPFDATIDAGNIEVAGVARFGAIRVDGAAVIIGPGEWLVGGLRWSRGADTSVTAAGPNFAVYALPTGGFAVVNSASAIPHPETLAPVSGALVVANGTVLAGVINTIEICRPWVPRPRRECIEMVNFQVGDTGYGFVQTWERGFVLPRPDAFRVFMVEGGPKNNGATVILIEVAAPATPTVYVTAATLTIPAGALYAEAGPTLAVWPAGAIVRARVTALGTGGTSPETLAISIEVAA